MISTTCLSQQKKSKFQFAEHRSRKRGTFSTTDQIIQESAALDVIGGHGWALESLKILDRDRTKCAVFSLSHTHKFEGLEEPCAHIRGRMSCNPEAPVLASCAKIFTFLGAPGQLLKIPVDVVRIEARGVHRCSRVGVYVNASAHTVVPSPRDFARSRFINCAWPNPKNSGNSIAST